MQAQKLKEANDHFKTEKVNSDNQIASLKERIEEQTEVVEKLTLQMQGLKNTHATAVQQIDVKATNFLMEKTQLRIQEAYTTGIYQEVHYALQQQFTESQTREKTILEQSETQMQSILEEKAILEKKPKHNIYIRLHSLKDRWRMLDLRMSNLKPCLVK